MYRLFAAIAIPDDIGDELATELQTGVLRASWRPQANFHVTLRFFGDLSHDLALELDRVLGEIILAPFEIELDGVGWFGRKSPTSIWARVRETDPLRSLSAQCERAARHLGLPLDKRPFIPHVTLAYLHDVPLDDVVQWADKHHRYCSRVFSVNLFELFQSELGNGPSRYTSMATYPLTPHANQLP